MTSRSTRIKKQTPTNEKLLFLFVIVTFLAFAFFYLTVRDSGKMAAAIITHVSNHETTANIENVELRTSMRSTLNPDVYVVTYRYVDSSGTLHTGEDETLASLGKPAGAVSVKYNNKFPNFSKLQNTAYPLIKSLAGFIAAILFFPAIVCAYIGLLSRTGSKIVFTPRLQQMVVYFTAAFFIALIIRMIAGVLVI